MEALVEQTPDGVRIPDDRYPSPDTAELGILGPGLPAIPAERLDPDPAPDAAAGHLRRRRVGRHRPLSRARPGGVRAGRGGRAPRRRRGRPHEGRARGRPRARALHADLRERVHGSRVRCGPRRDAPDRRVHVPGLHPRGRRPAVQPHSPGPLHVRGIPGGAGRRADAGRPGAGLRSPAQLRSRRPVRALPRMADRGPGHTGRLHRGVQRRDAHPRPGARHRRLPAAQARRPAPARRVRPRRPARVGARRAEPAAT